jgi:ubiquinone/menaquinone biosynthesis C-methylase UbiE
VAVELDTRFFRADPDFLLLDIGPGVGALAEQYSRDRRVVTVELDEAVAEQVAKRSSPVQLSSCCGDAHRLPVRSASVDGVIALEVLEHVDDPDRVLAEASRVLKPGGALCVAVPTGYTEHVYSRVHPRYMSNATHVRIFKKRDLEQKLRRYGFDVSVVKPEHLEPALSWMVHSVLRSTVHPTGIMLDHHWVDPKVERTVARISRTKGVGRSVSWARRHFGKSWYLYARKRP